MAKHKETEKLYRAAYREVISAASYDNGISDATKAENLTKEMRIGRSAYGALIEGKTVCSATPWRIRRCVITSTWSAM